MERVTIRLKNTGPIGFARAVTPITLQALRQLMVEQLGAALPADGFASSPEACLSHSCRRPTRTTRRAMC